jgi:hypothetical protein
VTHLASADTAYVNGTELLFDGGIAQSSRQLASNFSFAQRLLQPLFRRNVILTLEFH